MANKFTFEDVNLCLGGPFLISLMTKLTGDWSMPLVFGVGYLLFITIPIRQKYRKPKQGEEQ